MVEPIRQIMLGFHYMDYYPTLRDESLSGEPGVCSACRSIIGLALCMAALSRTERWRSRGGAEYKYIVVGGKYPAELAECDRKNRVVGGSTAATLPRGLAHDLRSVCRGSRLACVHYWSVLGRDSTSDAPIMTSHQVAFQSSPNAGDCDVEVAGAAASGG